VDDKEGVLSGYKEYESGFRDYLFEMDNSI
jgi:hypothetical protein